MIPLDEKLAKYRGFWDNEPVERPLIGFDAGGWFPFQRFRDLRNLQDGASLEADTLYPENCLADYRDFIGLSLEVEDDFIKGVCPVSAVPWMEAMLGCRLRRNGESVWAEDRKASWEDLSVLRIAEDNAWLKTYLSFVKSLERQAAGAYPVGLPILRGVSDLLGALRGHGEAVIDGMENPELTRGLGRRCAEELVKVIGAHLDAAGQFHGGFFIEQYSLWAPGRIARLQEDATAIYSPDLYVETVIESDRLIARAFPYSLLHLHGSSLFLLREFLSIEEIGVFQVNRDVGEMGLPEMIPYLRKIQDAGRRLYVRGPLTAEDFRLLRDKLSPAGLMIQSVLGSVKDARDLADRIAGLW